MNSSTLVAKRMRDMKITDQMLFASREYGDYLRNLLSYACRRIRRYTPPVVVLYDESKKSVAWTDNSSININAGHPTVAKFSSNKRVKKARVVLGLLTHEFGHCRFTDFAAAYSAQQRLAMGLGWHPTLPEELEDDVQKNKDDFELFLKEHPERIHQVLECWHYVDNIIEDGYIEECLYHVMSGILLDGLNYLRYKQSKTAPTLGKLLEMMGDGKIDEYDAVTSLLLTYVKYGKLNCDWDNPEEVHCVPMELIRACRPYLDDAIYGTSTQVRLRNIHLTFLVLWPVIRERIESMPEATTGCSSASSMATGEMCSGAPTLMTKEAPTGVSKSEDTGKSGSAKSRKETAGKMAKTAKDADKDKPGEKGSKSGEDGEGCDDSGGDDSDSADPGKGDTHSDDDTSTGGDSEVGEDEGESGDSGVVDKSTVSADGGDDFDRDAPEEPKELEAIVAKSYGEPIGQERKRSDPDTVSDLDDEGEVDESADEGYTTVVDAEEGYDAAEVIRAMQRIEKDLKETAAVIAANDELLDEIRNETKSIDFGAAHRGLHIIISRIKNVSDSTKALYNRTMKPIEELADTMARRVLPIIKKKDQAANMPMTGFFTGSRFDASRLVFNDWRNFRQDVSPQPDTRLVISVLVDESGSMQEHGRDEMAKAAAIAIYRFCEKCGIKCAVLGHTAGITLREENDVMFQIYADYDIPDRNDKYRMMDIRGRGNNRDGAAILFAGERLLKRPEPTKLMFIISDGAPCAFGYSGSAAEDDMAQIVGELRRRGVIIFSAAIGSDKMSIHRIYGDGFIDITNLSTLPDQLLSLVKRYIR